MRFIGVSLIVLWLMGCASQSTNIQYYLLFSPNDVRQADLTDGISLRLNKIDVPEYLKQRGMPVMTKPNQLHISKTHLWGESFESAINQLVTYSLEPDYLVLSQGMEDATDLELNIELLHLIPTHEGEVQLSARYQISRNNEVLMNRAYANTFALRTDGYAHTVEVYRDALFAFTQEVKEQLRTL